MTEGHYLIHVTDSNGLYLAHPGTEEVILKAFQAADAKRIHEGSQHPFELRPRDGLNAAQIGNVVNGLLSGTAYESQVIDMNEEL